MKRINIMVSLFAQRSLAVALVVAATFLAGCPKPGSTSSSSSGGNSSSSSSSSGGAGTLGNACDAQMNCSAFNGTALTCVAGECQLPGCANGAVGCGCHAGACTEAQTTCTDSLCVPTGCTAGTAACVCAAGMCDTSTRCVNGTCQYPTRLTLGVGNAAVRSCDVVVTESARTLDKVVFPANVVGEFYRRAPKTGVSFTLKTDAAATATVATLEFTGTTAVAATDVTLTPTCFDKSGQAVAAPDVQLR
jgi:hypothetical protein